MVQAAVIQFNFKHIAVRIFLLLLFICLTSCSSDSTIRSFLTFPIQGMTLLETQTEGYPLASHERVALSVIWYGLLFATLSVLPLLLKGCFKKKSFYESYRNFWWYAGFVFSVLTIVLTGFVVSVMGIFAFLGCYQFILLITLVPAIFQYKLNNKSDD